MSNIEVLNGYEITEEYLDKVKSIASSGYNDVIYNNYYNKIYNINKLVGIHYGFVNNDIIEKQFLAITDTWFIFYMIDEAYLKIFEWISKSNICISDKIDMMKYILDLLFNYKNKMIQSSLRHDTSYNIYTKLYNREYIDTYKDKLFIDIVTPKDIKEDILLLKNKYNSLENTLENNIYNEYYKYILHDIEFKINDNFINTYQKRL